MWGWGVLLDLGMTLAQSHEEGGLQSHMEGNSANNLSELGSGFILVAP